MQKCSDVTRQLFLPFYLFLQKEAREKRQMPILLATKGTKIEQLKIFLVSESTRLPYQQSLVDHQITVSTERHDWTM